MGMIPLAIMAVASIASTAMAGANQRSQQKSIEKSNEQAMIANQSAISSSFV